MIQQYLTFEIDKTTYAVNVFQIQEVLEYSEPQPIPCSSPLLIGIIRSRNTNIAIMSLRKKFELPNRITDKLTRIVVLEVVNADDGTINLYGIIADKVNEVIEIDDSNLEPMPKANKFAGSEFVTAAISTEENYTLILDVNKIFSDEELSKIKSQNQETKQNSTEKQKRPQKSKSANRQKTEASQKENFQANENLIEPKQEVSVDDFLNELASNDTEIDPADKPTKKSKPRKTSARRTK